MFYVIGGTKHKVLCRPNVKLFIQNFRRLMDAAFIMIPAVTLVGRQKFCLRPRKASLEYRRVCSDLSVCYVILDEATNFMIMIYNGKKLVTTRLKKPYIELEFW